MNVLFLTPWYPSEKDAMSGLFVQKHVEAVRAQGCDVRVIYSQSLLGSVLQYRKLLKEGWTPDIVQLNVIQKQGLLAEALDIPYIIVEHWSGYLPENGQFMRMCRFKRDMYRHIAKNAAMILTVSSRHAEAMKDCGIRNNHWGRINNVVDDFFFEQSAVSSKKSDKKTLLHVSCFDEKAKNVKGLLRAAKMLSEKRQDWKLVLVGTGPDIQDVQAYAQSIEIPEEFLQWTGELTPREVSDEFNKADVFVLPSHYENAPVVLSESLAKGVPVISSRVGGIPEMVNEDSGVLVTPGSDDELFSALDLMLDRYKEYNRDMIREKGKPYSFAAVGKRLMDIYREVL